MPSCYSLQAITNGVLLGSHAMRFGSRRGPPFSHVAVTEAGIISFRSGRSAWKMEDTFDNRAIRKEFNFYILYIASLSDLVSHEIIVGEM